MSAPTEREFLEGLRYEDKFPAEDCCRECGAYWGAVTDDDEPPCFCDLLPTSRALDEKGRNRG